MHGSFTDAAAMDGRRHILVVDDTPDGREPLARLLRMSGYEVSCAGGGEEALEQLRAAGADLVILDLMMPGMSGLDVLRHMREDARTAGVPVIVFSALENGSSEVDRLRGMGVRDYFQKSAVSFSDLLERVGNALGQGRPEGEQEMV